MPGERNQRAGDLARAQALGASAARMLSVNSGPLVSTSDEENGVDRFMPYITTPMCSVWPMSPHSTKRGRSRRRGQVA